LAFNVNSQWLACSSDKGTVHIFSINPKGDKKDKGKKKLEAPPSPTGETSPPTGASSVPSPDGKEKEGKKKDKKNPKSSFSFMKSFLPKYFSSEWSFAQFRVPVQQDVRSIVAFGTEKNSIIVVSADGTFYKALFDAEKPGLECVQEAYDKFIKTAEDEA